MRFTTRGIRRVVVAGSLAVACAIAIAGTASAGTTLPVTVTAFAAGTGGTFYKLNEILPQ